MGVMTGHATEGALAFTVALRPLEPDGLESRENGGGGGDGCGVGPSGVTMAFAAEPQKLSRGPPVGPEGERESFGRSKPAGRLDVCPAGTVTALAGDIGDHRRVIHSLAAMSRELSGVALETFSGD